MSRPGRKKPWKSDHSVPRALHLDRFERITAHWQRGAALRKDIERPQALIEIDALAGMALNVTPEELRIICRVQFPVLQQQERFTWYDQNGGIVYTTNCGLTGVGRPRVASNNGEPTVGGLYSENIGPDEARAYGQKSVDNTMAGGPVERTIVYEGSLESPDREHGFEVALAHFEKRFEACTGALRVEGESA